MKDMPSKILRKFAPKRIHSLSDNQTYPQFCSQASSDELIFNNFRRSPIYTEILEHVTEKLGLEYFKIISDNPDFLHSMAGFKENDNYGNPVKYDYPEIGMISPSTLRYIKVLSDIRTLFETLDDFDICEIGVGYGGQCRILNSYYTPETYCLVDIQPALALAQKYLDNFPITSTLSYRTMDQLAQGNYDLVISNYAFTELPRKIQDVYMEKIILCSKRGYITYNEITPKEFKSYKADELAAIIPGAQILEEKPLTHPTNCIIVWETT
ncbi:putative sugar O-methyltransferase [Desulfospira joergensenii]|uniref:putative sugar O-methyltransferase n=1 Tax=Desulfospira joergensenii TaxID=53329 RepID=UPI0003B3AD28|nr:putative sugar O-methyltransferase [Desulfospira joergensenii]